MKKIFISLILVILSHCIFALNVTVTTKLLENAVKDIGGDKVKVSTLVTVSSCPGHVDISPSQISKAKKSDYIFYHGFEKYVTKIGNPSTINISEGKEKNLLIPSDYINALNLICQKLSKKDVKNKHFYLNNLNKRTKEIEILDKEIKSKTKSLRGKRVICSVNNKTLLEYFGFKVIGTFPIPDKITPSIWKNLYKKGKEAKVIYCIDNYQSGKDTSLQLSKDIKAKHFWTSNFPGAIKDTDTIEKTLRKNMEYCLNGHN